MGYSKGRILKGQERFLIVLVLFFLSIPGAAAEEELVLKEEEDGKKVEVEIGRRIIVGLSGNKTTGYQWELKGLTGEAVRQAGEADYVSDWSLASGTGGTFLFTFLAEEEGESVLHLVYRRPWEEKKPIETFTVTVKVYAP